MRTTLFIIFITFPCLSSLWAQFLEPFGLEEKTVTALAVSPLMGSITFNNHLLAGTKSSGIFARNLSSPDSNWVNIGLIGKKISSLCVYHWGVGPVDFNTLFAAVELEPTSGDSIILYQYTQEHRWIPSDSGLDHNQIQNIKTMDGFYFSGHEPPQPLFVGGDWSIYRSTLLGKSWEKIWSAPGQVNVLYAHQACNEVWAGGSWGRDVQYPWIARSVDGGLTWDRLDISTGGPNILYSLAMNDANTDTVYAGLKGAVIKTDDSGKTWNFTSLCEFPAYILGLDIDSANPEHLWAGGPIDEEYFALWAGPFLFWESYDGGECWQEVKPILQPEPLGVMSLVSDPQQRGVVYIATNGSGVWRYSNRSKPPRMIKVPEDYSTIQAAINASNSGDTVLVGPGKYVENIDFLGKGILLISAEGSEETIIDGGQNGSVVSFASHEDSTTRIKGFTIRNGSGIIGADGRQYGGGIYCSSSSPRIEYNVITENNVSSGCGAYGGGIAILGNAHPIIEGNRFIANSVNSLCDALVNYGGGIYMAGSAAPLVYENIFSSNYADWGGGIAIQDSGHPVIQKNRILNNRPHNVWIGEQALPLIGGRSGMGNDILQNQGGGRGNSLFRSGDGQTINAQYNYFGVCPPGENEVYSLEQFDLRNCSTRSLLDYFPMEVGNRWSFGNASILNATITDTITEAIIDTVTIAGRHFYRFDHFRGLDLPLIRLTEENRLTWRIDPMSVLEKAWVNFTADFGDRWEVNTGLENWTVELQSKTDTVAVPAGTFYNCYRFHFFFHGADNDWDEWYAPGIGPVMRILYGFGIIEYPLVSADIHGIHVSVEERSSREIPRNMVVYQNYPNPFNTTTLIEYALSRKCQVEIKIFDPLGREVRTLIAGRQNAGIHRVTWNSLDNTGSPVASGVYFYTMTAEGFSETRKLLLIR